MLWTCRSDGNNKHIRHFVKGILGKSSQFCPKSVTRLLWWIHTENILGGSGMGFMANDLVIQWSEYKVLCLHTLGYVTAGNSRLLNGYHKSGNTPEPSSE